MSKIQLSPEYKELLEAIPADTRRKLSFHDVRQFIKHYQPQIKAQQARIEELEESKLSDLFLANFPYEDWQHGDDDKARIGDWVHLGWQDHNGADHSDGIGRICLHHDTEIPVILMVEGFEDDGEPHGTYASMSFHPWNTISRVSEKEARQALKEKTDE